MPALPFQIVHSFSVCSYERFDLFPYNNGVMLWNMPFMRKTNDEFVEWILKQHNGLHYGSECRLEPPTLTAALMLTGWRVRKGA